MIAKLAPRSLDATCSTLVESDRSEISVVHGRLFPFPQPISSP